MSHEQLMMLGTAVQGFVDVQERFIGSLPPIPQSSWLGEKLGAFGTRHMQAERDMVIDQAQRNLTHARLVLRLVDQLLS